MTLTSTYISTSTGVAASKHGQQTQQLKWKSGATHPWMLQASFSCVLIFLLKDGLQTPNMDSRYGTPSPLVPRCWWLNCQQLRCFGKYSSPLFEGIKVTKHEQQLQVLEWTSGAPIARCRWYHCHVIMWLCKTIIYSLLPEFISVCLYHDFILISFTISPVGVHSFPIPKSSGDFRKSYKELNLTNNLTFDKLLHLQ